MQLWILRPKFEDDGLVSPWGDWAYNKAHGLVVRAETEEKARRFAQDTSGDETEYEKADVWMDPHYSTCEPLPEKGKPGVVIIDYVCA